MGVSMNVRIDSVSNRFVELRDLQHLKAE